ncbi:hypothetical protein AB0467_23295 [Streptomyces sp. NPDC052095]|uniref:hypothetical protein n=1 Tax=unclassified Streptomyces TaxID=2593676 RepID=UPI00344C8D5B
MTEAPQEITWAERLTEGLIVAVVLGLSFYLSAGPAMLFCNASWSLINDSGAPTAARILVPLVVLVLLMAPLVLTFKVFRSGLRKGKRRLTAAVPAALTLLGGSAVLFVVLVLAYVYG